MRQGLIMGQGVGSSVSRPQRGRETEEPPPCPMELFCGSSFFDSYISLDKSALIFHVVYKQVFNGGGDADVGRRNFFQKV